MIEKKKYINEYPKLMEEWDWDANNKNELFPDRLTHGSTKKAHWICNQGHHYLARIDHRTIMGSGCPYCSGKKSIVGVNDLTTTHPHLLQEWDYEKNSKAPYDFLAGSNKKVNWVCKKCGHHWSATICSRTLNNTNCPACMTSQKGKTKTENTIKRRGSLAQEYPNLAIEWNYEKNGGLIPEKVHASSRNIVWWIGECGHSWEASIAHRVLGTGCPFCSGKRVLTGFNDLATKFPDVAKEWHPVLNGDLTPNNITAYNDRKIWWNCSICGMAYKSSVYSRTSLNTGCPICNNKIVIDGLNDLATTHPQIAQEWNYSRNGKLRPVDVVAGSNIKVWWKCSEKHEWEATVVSRSSGRGCPICAKKKRSDSRQKTYVRKNGSFFNNYPEIAAQWHPTKNAGLLPNDVTAGSGKKVWWICERGREWEAAIYSRVSGRGCPYCNSEHSTSFPEQALYFYISQVTPAINRYKVFGKEIDVFLPLLNIGIEYNGRYYHQNRIYKDIEKQRFLFEKGIRIININEGDKSFFEEDTVYYRYVNSDYTTLGDVIKYVLSICKLPLVDVDISRDRKYIFEQYIQQEKDNSLAVIYPWTIEEWDYERNGKLTPWQVSYGSNKRIYWRCKKCGYQWDSVAHTRKKSGCPCCAKRVAVAGVNDLSTTHPHLVKEWDYERNEKNPTDVVAGSHQYVWWVCKNGHRWRAQVKSRVQGTGCPKCKDKN